MPTTPIYVRLLDEGTDVWWPVEAIREGPDSYRIVTENMNPEDQQWEFQSGELVRCEEHLFGGATKALVAVARANFQS